MVSKATSPTTNGAGHRKLTSWIGLSVERLRQVLDYDPLTGIFRWKERVAHCIQVGDIAGTTTDNGYVLIAFGGQQYEAHRLAWLYVYGEITRVDHKDRVRNNNILTNLRPATDKQNSYNKSAWGSLGVKGVSKKGNRFVAQITVDGTNYYLGIFKTIEEASAVYQAAAKEHFGEFAGG